MPAMTADRLIPLFLSLGVGALADTLDPTPFAGYASISFPGYAGGDAELANFPVLVKISSETIPGFDYSPCAPNGADVRFAASDGTLLAHEIDTWDPSGTSLVWVRLPRLAGTDTSMTFYWGAAVSSLPAVSAADVWTAYASVWHLNDSLQDSASGGNQLTALGGSSPVPDGIVGTGFFQANSSKQGLYTVYPIAHANGSARSVLTLSGWFNPAKSYDSENARLFSTKAGGSNGYKGNGFEAIASSKRLIMRGNGSDGAKTFILATGWTDNTSVGSWTHFAGVFNGTSATAYFNGESKGSGTIATITDATRPMGIGNTGNKDPAADNVFYGTMDEMRLYDGAAPAEWVRAEYDTVARHAAFTAYGPAVYTRSEPLLRAKVTSIAPTAAAFAGVLPFAGTDAAMTQAASTCDIYFSCAPAGEPLPAGTLVAAGVSASGPFEYALENLDALTDYVYAFHVTNNLGVGAEAIVAGEFSTNPDRTVRIAEKTLDGANAVAAVTLAFGGNAHTTNTLFAVYGPQQGGEGTNGWENVERIGVVHPDTRTLAYTMPASWGAGAQALRFLLCRGREPSYDTRLEYLRADGAEVVITDYVPTGASRIETRVRLNTVSTISTLFCARGPSGANDAFSGFYISGEGSGWRFDYGGTWYGKKDGGEGAPIPVPATTGVLYDLEASAEGFRVNGELIYARTDPSPLPFTSGAAMQLFASYANGSAPGIAPGNFSRMDFYHLRTYDGGTMTHEYLPGVLDGAVGLFDTVENRMLLPYIGTFIAGPEITADAGVVTFDVADATPALFYRIPTLVLIL